MLLTLTAGRVTHPDAPQQKLAEAVSVIAINHSSPNDDISLFMGLLPSQREVVNSDSFQALPDT
jgi:hypothetical protein